MPEDARRKAEPSSSQPADAAAAGFPADISHLIAATSADGIIAVDDQGIIRLANPAAEELFARPARYLLGTQFGIPIAAGRATEVNLMLPGGRERVVEMRVIATSVEGERLHIAALRDITRRRQAEREFEAALERQHVTVAVAAHELHNPLAAISMLAHVLQDQQATMTATERAQLIDRIAERSTRLQALLRKLLTASRIDAAAVRTLPEPVPVLEVIVEQLAEAEGRSADIQVSCSPGLTAQVDRAELSMMLANYLDNALTYASQPIAITATEQDSWAQIRVTDAGPGVPETFVPHLFERFTREPAAERKAQGTGLGLWIARNFAQANGGDAWYEPHPPHGSCFCLRLPLPEPGTAAGS